MSSNRPIETDLRKRASPACSAAHGRRFRCHMRRFALLLLMIAAASGSGHAADDTFVRLVSARSLRCSFGPGSTVDWESGKPVVKDAKFEAVLQFDSVDKKNGKARLIGNQSAADVTLQLTPRGLTFVEETGSGNSSITTVFPDDAKGTRDFVVVHSRHISGLGSPLPSQYHGTCKVRE